MEIMDIAKIIGNNKHTCLSLRVSLKVPEAPQPYAQLPFALPGCYPDLQHGAMVEQASLQATRF